MTYSAFWRSLTIIYEEREAQAVARLVLEQCFGLTMTDMACGREVDDCELGPLQERLLRGEPVQYVLGESVFCGRRFRVASGVLIPRPETESLCRWLVEDERWRGDDSCSILDIGTGSGCIACTVAAELSQARVTAWDISEKALAMAARNARLNHVSVAFEQVDMLNNPPMGHWNIIVSNPPYVCRCEAGAMEHNVLDYEPHEALFVPDDDPLLFYRAIGDYALTSLNQGGTLYFEINPQYADPLESLLLDCGFTDVCSRKDLYGKIRFIKAKCL